MPNGIADDKKAVWERSRAWGVVFTIGDVAILIGTVGLFGAPLLVVLLYFIAITRGHPPWPSTILGLAIAAGSSSFAAWLIAVIGSALESWAMRRTGVKPH
jgi:hypothetical protein